MKELFEDCYETGLWKRLKDGSANDFKEWWKRNEPKVKELISEQSTKAKAHKETT